MSEYQPVPKEVWNDRLKFFAQFLSNIAVAIIAGGVLAIYGAMRLSVSGQSNASQIADFFWFFCVMVVLKALSFIILLGSR